MFPEFAEVGGLGGLRHRPTRSFPPERGDRGRKCWPGPGLPTCRSTTDAHPARRQLEDRRVHWAVHPAGRPAARRPGDRVRAAGEARPLPQVRHAVCRPGRRRLRDQCRARPLLRLPGQSPRLDRRAAREGRRARRRRSIVRQGNRAPDRLGGLRPVRRAAGRPAPLRLCPPAAPGAGDHRAGAARPHGPRAAARLAAQHGRGRQQTPTARPNRPSSRPRPTRSITGQSTFAKAASPISPWRWRMAAAAASRSPTST